MDGTRRRPAREASADSSVLVEALHRQLRDAIDALESGEQWQAWLDFGRKLHRYSFNNLILIFVQRPDASQVAGYRTWQSLGRQVRRGEQAIRVLTPLIRKAQVVDADGKPQRDPDGKPRLKQQVVGFRPAPVFDIAQTDGPPVPAPTAPELLSGGVPPGLWEALSAEVAGRGYQIRRGPLAQLGGANGLTKVSEREVWVRDDVDPPQAVKTLAHELAHVMLHVDGGAIAGCRGVIEVEAESVAHLVLGVHQVDTGDYTFPYVANWAHPIAAAEQVPMSEIVARTGARVMKAANEIITANRPSATVTTPDPVDAGNGPGGDIGSAGDIGTGRRAARPVRHTPYGRPGHSAGRGGRQPYLLPPPARLVVGAVVPEAARA